MPTLQALFEPVFLASWFRFWPLVMLKTLLVLRLACVTAVVLSWDRGARCGVSGPESTPVYFDKKDLANL